MHIAVAFSMGPGHVPCLADNSVYRDHRDVSRKVNGHIRVRDFKHLGRNITLRCVMWHMHGCCKHIVSVGLWRHNN